MSKLHDMIIILQSETTDGMEIALSVNRATVKIWGLEFEIDMSGGNEGVAAFLQSIIWLDGNLLTEVKNENNKP